ncbi:S8 family peptidase [Pseudonocardia sp. TRM90224]|uniref:S8 family peptidase n=1 Tax=Pseudonocardia sp. TRM90224 TaxID=2812678 RepID=UPI001E548419|nr:S8/S53 family peptidase [Pseudonocardia sp. TRM90224]
MTVDDFHQPTDEEIIEEARRLDKELPPTRSNVRKEISFAKELLVVKGTEYADLAADLVQRGGEEYKPPADGDWRTEAWGAERADLNKRYEDACLRVRLWTFPEAGVEEINKIELDFRDRGVHQNRILVGAKGTSPHPAGAPAAAATTGSIVLSAPTPGPPGLAVLDTGLPDGWADMHPGLAGAITQDPGDLPEQVIATDLALGHGLFICGLVRRSEPSVRMQVRRVLRFRIVDDAFLCAELGERTEPVVNLSIVTECQGGATAPVGIRTAVSALARKGTVVVAAAGNNGSDGQPVFGFFPAEFKNVIAVGAFDPHMSPPTQSGFSNHGRWVDVWAPGTRLKSTYVKSTDLPTFAGGWAIWSGTSFAAPLVSAKIAKLVQDKAPDDTRLPIQVAEDFLSDVDRSDFSGNGRQLFPSHLVELTKDS